MYARIVDVNLKTEKLNEIRETLTNEVLPTIKKQPGFVDVIEALDPASGHFVCQTFWKDRESLERYATNVFPTFEPRLQKYLTSEPQMYTLQVETSTVHQIAKGKAA
jgi:quinol monooxygenase YgiN